jgi:hypothetical protein
MGKIEQIASMPQTEGKYLMSKCIFFLISWETINFASFAMPSVIRSSIKWMEFQRTKTFSDHTTSIFKDQIKLNCIVIHRRKTSFHCIALIVMVVLMGSRKWKAAYSEEKRALLTFGIQKISPALKIRDYRLLLPFSILPARESSVGIRMEMNVFTEELKTTCRFKQFFWNGVEFLIVGYSIGAPKYRSTITNHFASGSVGCCCCRGPLPSGAGSSSIAWL